MTIPGADAAELVKEARDVIDRRVFAYTPPELRDLITRLTNALERVHRELSAFKDAASKHLIDEPQITCDARDPKSFADSLNSHANWGREAAAKLGVAESSLTSLSLMLAEYRKALEHCLIEHGGFTIRGESERLIRATLALSPSSSLGRAQAMEDVKR